VKGFCVALFFFTACNPSDSQTVPTATTEKMETVSNSTTIERQPYGTIAEIPLPANFKRKKTTQDNFDNYLQTFPLKEDATVYLHNGAVKNNQSAHFAVLDITVGKENLQQCADAIM